MKRPILPSTHGCSLTRSLQIGTADHVGTKQSSTTQVRHLQSILMCVFEEENYSEPSREALEGTKYCSFTRFCYPLGSLKPLWDISKCAY
jgi:hypothetical protein